MSKAISLFGRWLAVLAICVVARLLPEIWYEFNRMQGIRIDEYIASSIGPLFLVPIVVVEFFRFVGGLIVGNVLSTLRYLVPALIAGASFFASPIVGSLGGDLSASIQRAKFALFRERYEECAATARTSYGANKIKTCEKRIAGNYVQAIVYDTSGEIALPSDAQSPAFRDYLMRDIKDQQPSESPPYGACCGQVSTQLAPHFFFLRTEC
jgi:hypothetical protein